VETINLDLFIGQVGFITGPKQKLTPAPIFCAEVWAYPFRWSTEDSFVLQSPIADHPTTLSANGDADLWSVCSSQLWYNLGKGTTSVPDCQEVTLYINEYTTNEA
jgi:hypothetical protein